MDNLLPQLNLMLTVMPTIHSVPVWARWARRFVMGIDRTEETTRKMPVTSISGWAIAFNAVHNWQLSLSASTPQYRDLHRRACQDGLNAFFEAVKTPEQHYKL